MFSVPSKKIPVCFQTVRQSFLGSAHACNKCDVAFVACDKCDKCNKCDKCDKCNKCNKWDTCDKCDKCNSCNKCNKVTNVLCSWFDVCLHLCLPPLSESSQWTMSVLSSIYSVLSGCTPLFVSDVSSHPDCDDSTYQDHVIGGVTGWHCPSRRQSPPLPIAHRPSSSLMGGRVPSAWG